MNVVLDDVEEVYIKKKVRKQLEGMKTIEYEYFHYCNDFFY